MTGEDPEHQRLFNVDNRPGGDRVRCSDLGRHQIRLALALSDISGPRELQASALAESLFTPALPYQGSAHASGFLGLEGGNTLQAVWAKPARDGKGWILRLNETMGQRGKAKVLLAEGYTACPTDLLEGDGGKALTQIKFKPYDLLSLRICKS